MLLSHMLLRPYLSLRPCIRCLTTSATNFSGHNKWSKIKEGKGANDQLKSKIYSRANREIIFAARKGDSTDPSLNTALSNAISKAKLSGVPKSNIQAALDQAQKSKNDAGLELQYEVLFRGKVGLIIECYSDNSTRTLRELKEVIKRHGAHLTAVAFMFEKKASIQVSLLPHQSYEEMWMEALEHGAQDLSEVQTMDPDAKQRIVDVVASPDKAAGLVKWLSNLEYDVLVYETVRVPMDVGFVVDDETRDAVRVFIDDVEEHPDVHRVLVSPKL